MELNENEIIALEKLAELSSQSWFQIRTPRYIWDADNKVRMSVVNGCKEFIECSRNFMVKLSKKQRGFINELEKKIDDACSCDRS